MIHYYKNHIHHPTTLPCSRMRWVIENRLFSHMRRRISHPVSEDPFRRKLVSGKSCWVSLRRSCGGQAVEGLILTKSCVGQAVGSRLEQAVGSRSAGHARCRSLVSALPFSTQNVWASSQFPFRRKLLGQSWASCLVSLRRSCA